MKRLTILLGVFLSIFILVLIPSINCVNANIQNENNLELKNINIDDIKTIRNRILNNDCNCKKTADYNNSGNPDHDYICFVLITLMIIMYFSVSWIWMFEKLSQMFEKIWIIIITPLIRLYILFDCYWIPPDNSLIVKY